VTGAVSRRYAKALFALARERNLLESTADELVRLGQAAANAQLATVLRSPLLSESRRALLANALIADLRLSELLASFVRLLAERQRLAELPGIADFFVRFLDAERGRVRLGVRSASALTEGQHRRVVDAFAKLTGKEVIPTVVIDPDLLGGLVAEVEGRVYDGSVRTQLDRLAKQLAGKDAH
jgi:F-type H+-transporting ATPase subunit delta